MSKVLVALPTFNEEKSIAPMLERIKKAKLPAVVCDGYSVDQTVQITREFNIPVILRDQHGKGSAIQKILNYAHRENFEYVVIIDCDQTYSLEDLLRIVRMISSQDMIVGVRNLKDITFPRRLVNYLFIYLIRFLFGGNIKDPHSGLRALKTKRFHGILSAPGFEIETEISILSILKKMHCEQLPITYATRVGNSKISVFAIIPGLILTFRYFIQSKRFLD